MANNKSQVAKWAYWRGVQRGRDDCREMIDQLVQALHDAADLLDEVNSDARYYGADMPYYCSYSGNGARAVANRITKEMTQD